MKKFAHQFWRISRFAFGKVFRRRNIIVVSEGNVKHYPVSAKIQFAGLACLMGVLSWGSYSTGSYIATQEILAEKDRKIKSTTLANRRMEEQYGLLKADLAKLSSDSADLSEYDKFVLYQQSEKMNAIARKASSGLDDRELQNISNNLLEERVNYLEELVDSLKDDQLTLLTKLRTRTGEQIVAYEDIIKTTGLNLAKLTKHPQAKLKIKEIKAIAEAEQAAIDGEFVNQGGPYVPDSWESHSEEYDGLFEDLERMMLLSDMTHNMPFALPMEDARITSQYGRRRDPITKRWATHKGMDFVSEVGTPVHATAGGEVIFAGRNGAYGHLVEIDHGYGVTTRYAHLKEIMVEEGDTISKGDTVGVQGNSGRSTGSHLHYEVRFNRGTLNPRNFIEAGKNVL